MALNCRSASCGAARLARLHCTQLRSQDRKKKPRPYGCRVPGGIALPQFAHTPSSDNSRSRSFSSGAFSMNRAKASSSAFSRYYTRPLSGSRNSPRLHCGKLGLLWKSERTSAIRNENNEETADEKTPIQNRWKGSENSGGLRTKLTLRRLNHSSLL
jgi:hypothetical protein